MKKSSEIYDYLSGRYQQEDPEESRRYADLLERLNEARSEPAVEPEAFGNAFRASTAADAAASGTFHGGAPTSSYGSYLKDKEAESDKLNKSRSTENAEKVKNLLSQYQEMNKSRTAREGNALKVGLGQASHLGQSERQDDQQGFTRQENDKDRTASITAAGLRGSGNQKPNQFAGEDLTFYVRLGNANTGIDKIKDMIKKDPTGRLYGKNKAIIEQTAANLAVDVASLKDPKASVMENDIKRELANLGTGDWSTRTSTVLSLMDNLQNYVNNTAKTREDVKSKIESKDFSGLIREQPSSTKSISSSTSTTRPQAKEIGTNAQGQKLLEVEVPEEDM